MLAEQIVNGLVLGAMYALIALGYTLVFGVLDKLNFAHGDIFMFGGFVAVSVLALGAPLWAGAFAAFVVCGVLGLAIELVSFRKFRSHDAQVTAALSSLACSIILIDATQKVWGTEPVALPVSTAIRTAAVTVQGLRIAYVNIGILGLAILLMIGLYVLIVRTRMGRNIRAVADSAVAAELLGIDVTRVTQQTFFLASGLAGLAGVMLAVRTGFVTTELGLTFGIKALAVMAIGGMGDLRGAVVGGLLAGIVEAMATQLGLGKFGDMAVWLLMIVVLLVRPAGLFGGLRKETRA
jgi:branched-chain amino acid transport system permease protein